MLPGQTKGTSWRSIGSKKVEIRMKISIINCMHRVQDKLLATVLVLLVGLSPLHNTLADILLSQTDARSMADCMHGADMPMPADESTHDCDCAHCAIGLGCADHVCSSSHCASTSMAIISTFSFPSIHTVANNIISPGTHFESQELFALFRPPIV